MRGNYPQELAELAKGQMPKKRHELAQALQGRIGPHQHIMLVQLLTHIDYLDEAIAQVELKIGERLRPFRSELARLQAAPGIKRRTAEAVWTALPDLSYFPSADHIASCAGVCPGNNESAGKSRSGKERQVSHLLRDVLIEAACAARRKREPTRRPSCTGLPPVVEPSGRRWPWLTPSSSASIRCSLAASTARTSVPTTFNQRRRTEIRNQLVHKLEDVGYAVTLQPVAVPA